MTDKTERDEPCWRFARAFCLFGGIDLHFFPPVKRQATRERRQWDFIYIYGRYTRFACNALAAERAARRGEGNARDGQRRSLKIESICAFGLEIQIRREISVAAPCPSGRLSSHNRYIHRASIRAFVGRSVGSISAEADDAPAQKYYITRGIPGD